MTGPDDEAFVAVVCSVPLMGEALADSLAGMANVRCFPAGRGDTASLLRALHPDAVVVDTDEEAEAAAEFALESGVPCVHYSFAEGTLRVFDSGGWAVRSRGRATAEAIRDALVPGLFGRPRLT